MGDRDGGALSVSDGVLKRRIDFRVARQAEPISRCGPCEVVRRRSALLQLGPVVRGVRVTSGGRRRREAAVQKRWGRGGGGPAPCPPLSSVAAVHAHRTQFSRAQREGSTRGARADRLLYRVSGAQRTVHSSAGTSPPPRSTPPPPWVAFDRCIGRDSAPLPPKTHHCACIRRAKRTSVVDGRAVRKAEDVSSVAGHMATGGHIRDAIKATLVALIRPRRSLSFPTRVHDCTYTVDENGNITAYEMRWSAVRECVMQAASGTHGAVR
ncbi:unnamed protein product, partial [Iphiclides podalirius]